ncbi:hypothetical protein RchiOBHm_Chr5g0046081 [Rosa chinensis]|uniref:Uncharacterized protein n=1 Tax=Rosa chinensis TaxID=74649 RepID=A0A2P6QE15_ROSCH|nr:hypothetical protein RchiOBHm_Chr5g0046081 [Rosa chinensis]
MIPWSPCVIVVPEWFSLDLVTYRLTQHLLPLYLANEKMFTQPSYICAIFISFAASLLLYFLYSITDVALLFLRVKTHNTPICSQLIYVFYSCHHTSLF